MSRRAVVITGGAGGLGQAVARRALESSTSTVCVLVDLHESANPALAAEFGEERVHYLRCDVTDEQEVEAAARAAVEWGGTPAVLVNAAGSVAGGSTFELELEQWRRVIDTHLTGTWLWCRAAARYMKDADGGAIVNVSSVAARFGWPRRAPYASAKAGIEELTRSLAVEWAELGVRVNAVALGYVETPMLEQVVQHGTLTREEAASWHALGRLGRPEEVARVIMFLASEEASFMTGSVVTVDGGFSILKGAR